MFICRKQLLKKLGKEFLVKQKHILKFYLNIPFMNLFFFKKKKKGVIQLFKKFSFKHLVLCLRLHMISPKPKFPLHIIQLESGTSSLDNKNKKYSCYHKLHWKTIVSLK